MSIIYKYINKLKLKKKNTICYNINIENRYNIKNI